MNRELPCTEIVVYSIAPELTSDFQRIHAELFREIARLPGFISAETLRSSNDDETWLDVVSWASEEEARAAYDSFADLLAAPRFMNVVGEVRFSGHFRTVVSHQSSLLRRRVSTDD